MYILINSFFENDFKVLFLENYLIFSILFLLSFTLFYNNFDKNKFFIFIFILTYLSLGIIFILFLLLLNQYNFQSIILNFQFINDILSFFSKFLILISLFFSILISIEYLKIEKLFNYEFIIIILISLLSMFLLSSSLDFLSFYLAVELQSLCFYLLTTLKRNSYFSTEAGLKYFILGAFSSGLLLFGFSILYGFTGLTNFNDFFIYFNFSNNLYIYHILLGLIFITMGILFKLSIAPFHIWTLDVYEGAPIIITAFFNIVSKIAILIIFIRFFFNLFFYYFNYWHLILIYCAIFSLIIGTFGGLYQLKIKRLLAYSSISHMGYMSLALAIGTIESIQALFIYLIIYIILNINIFSLFIGIRKYNLTRVKSILDLFSLSKNNNILLFSLCLTLFSIAGIPPLAGFYSKLYLFFSTLKINLVLITIFAILTSVISSLYYIRFIKLLLFDSYSKWSFFIPISKPILLIIGFTNIINILFFLYPIPILLFTHKIILTFLI